MSIKLIALDVDDTLLTSNQKIAESTKLALKEALSKGIKVVLCSGRPLAGVSHYLDELGVQGDNQYVITYNGALVETAAGKVLSRKTIDNKDYRRIVKFVEAHKMQYYVLDDNSNVYTSNHDINRFAVIQAWENSAGIFVREPNELASDFEIAKAAIVGEKETLDQYEQAVKDEFSDEYYVVRAGANFIEIMHPEVNKGEGLTTLAEILGLNSDEIMAFGDEKNDLPMFDFVGSAVAMGNGSDIAKEHARYVTDTNDNDGIAKALKKYVL
ncbi:Cof-type HAD-IIB family hydrolase [Companilactobacillus bobalius]|uniref:HAD superfamily hydrolase n=2 Tax=Companilactobacillus bobalius TaxID=2801451 RepID=A0A0R1KUK5_9LACO|nr:Cof-type HAD-IIB family hydrolase [Companilactobacillus bobalius]GEO58949.1 hydrolase [Companilactobacillus paralimentarius]KAE9559526.1 hydrolase [Companilactobacillus bobalius]KAE9564055.1 hydrolase [Companilactobacillus bobalius]KRK83602.1 HAD superfamily hydrolase [Companilactobacillus bobalius DSM 19674]OVE96685.1 putative phosphatase [Companilactobacillus bobalius]